MYSYSVLRTRFDRGERKLLPRDFCPFTWVVLGPLFSVSVLVEKRPIPPIQTSFCSISRATLQLTEARNLRSAVAFFFSLFSLLPESPACQNRMTLSGSQADPHLQGTPSTPQVTTIGDIGLIRQSLVMAKRSKIRFPQGVVHHLVYL